MPLRVAAIFEIPTPYRQPIFEKIVEREDLKVDFYFLSRAQQDRYWDTNLFQELPAVFLPGKQICFKGYHTVYINFHVKKVLSKGKYDLFVLNGYAQPALFFLLRYCWKNSVPYVMVTESHLGKKRSPFLRLLKDAYVRKVYQRSKANLVMGSASKEYVISYGAPKDKIYDFPNTIDGPTYSSLIIKERDRKEQLKIEFNIQNEKVVLFVGTLNKRKGVHHLVEAFQQIIKRHPDVCLLLAGTGSMEQELRTLTNLNALEKKIIFTGFVQPKNLSKVYAVADIFVLPSIEEPFGAVICEAMAAGLPIIATRTVGAAADFVHHEENGMIVSPAKVEDLIDAMDKLLINDQKRKEMGNRSREIMQLWTHSRLEQSFLDAVIAAAGKS